MTCSWPNGKRSREGTDPRCLIFPQRAAAHPPRAQGSSALSLSPCTWLWHTVAELSLSLPACWEHTPWEGQRPLRAQARDRLKLKALVSLFTLQRAQAGLADISGLLLEKGEINLDLTVGEAGEFLHTINGSSPAHESRTITPHS